MTRNDCRCCGCARVAQVDTLLHVRDTCAEVVRVEPSKARLWLQGPEERDWVPVRDLQRTLEDAQVVDGHAVLLELQVGAPACLLVTCAQRSVLAYRWRLMQRVPPRRVMRSFRTGPGRVRGTRRTTQGPPRRVGRRRHAHRGWLACTTSATRAT